MRQYLDALQHIMDTGVDKPNRTGVDTRAVFGMQQRYDLSQGFPVMTTKKLAIKSVTAELLWIISGSTDNNKLMEMGSKIWQANADAPYWKPKAKFDGDLGRVYGAQWRHWQKPDGSEVDQLTDVINRIKNDPNDRRHIVVAWNPGELDQMALPPCHCFFQLFVANNKLSLHLYQRSCDMFLGVPFNITSYALLLSMMAQVTGYEPGEFVHTLGDAHIYHNHFDQVREQLSREPKRLPTLWLNPAKKNIDDFTMEDFELHDYEFEPAIKAAMAV